MRSGARGEVTGLLLVPAFYPHVLLEVANYLTLGVTNGKKPVERLVNALPRLPVRLII